MKQKKSVNSAVFSLSNKLYRLLWRTIYYLFFRLSPTPLFGYRRLILRLFKADIGQRVNIYPSVDIWLPENLAIGNDSSIGPNVKVYNQGKITIADRTIISQGAHLCASTHDYNDPVHPLLLAPINIESDVWVCAEAFVGPGVNLKEGGVLGARAVCLKNTELWSVYAGNPAAKIKNRRIHGEWTK